MKSKEEIEKQWQELQAELTHCIAVMNDFAIENQIERVEVLGSIIHFGINDYSSYIPAANGPTINNEWWSASSYDCWPTDEQREWLFGKDRNTWPKTSYDEE